MEYNLQENKVWEKKNIWGKSFKSNKLKVQETGIWGEWLC